MKKLLFLSIVLLQNFRNLNADLSLQDMILKFVKLQNLRIKTMYYIHQLVIRLMSFTDVQLPPM